MQTSRASATALGVAIVRAIERQRPAERRIGDDPYARRLVPAALFRLAWLVERTGLSERLGPGVMGFLTARERHIDDFVAAAVGAGARQVVILGAGYDTRAHRCEALQSGVRVFEVDHPATTQRVRMAKVQAILGARPGPVRYVAVDLGRQTLNEALSASGDDERRRTVFVWQGVTHYLRRDAVDRTLGFVARHAAPGSSSVFDYMYTSVLDGSNPRPEIERVQRSRWFAGERLVGAHRSRPAADGYAIVSALVP